MDGYYKEVGAWELWCIHYSFILDEVVLEIINWLI